MPLESWTAKLYTKLPSSIRRIYRRIGKEAKMRRKARLRKEWRTLEEILSDPKSTEEDKRIARMELVAREDPNIRARAKGDDNAV